MKFPALALALPLALLGAGVAGADPAPFDLAGPALRISVSRDGTSLPIAAVPQLAPGDRLTVEAPPPADATARYLLVAAFLRDPTNPPPAGWFARSESWKPARRGGGPIALTVPAGAHHLVLLLAPATGGDFATLKKAVAARPGAFVRAAQDLEQASLDRRRYDAYLAAIRKISASTPDALARLAPVVASSLHIKINQDCLQRQAELQAACLLDAKQSSVMGGDSTAGTSALSGAATDLALSLSATPAGGLGYYSPYISAIHEILGIFGAMHSAKYQYIPALGVPDGEALQLALNTPPSFGDPKSVLVAALPEIKPAQPPVPQLQPATPPAPALACLGGADPLPLALSPLFYATAYGHDLKLALHLPGGQRTELPLSADAARAGLVLAEPARLPAGLSGTISASLHGMWGFTRFAGPEMTLQTAGAWAWQQPEARKAEAGPLLLSGAPAACVSAITAAGADGIARPVSWKATESGALALTLPASPDRPEPLALTITGPAGTPPARLVVAPPARPAPPAARISAHMSESPAAGEAPPLALLLDNPAEIPADAALNFTLKASGEERFTGREVVEVSTADGTASTRLTLGSGLTLVDPAAMVASLTPARALGASAFGTLRARLVRAGVAGDWLNLGTLVRLPRLKRLSCPATGPCTLAGEGLYLLASLSATADFDKATSVAEGYPGFSLPVPRPGTDGVLYVRLHDAPEVVNRLRAAPAGR